MAIALVVFTSAACSATSDPQEPERSGAQELQTIAATPCVAACTVVYPYAAPCADGSIVCNNVQSCPLSRGDLAVLCPPSTDWKTN